MIRVSIDETTLRQLFKGRVATVPRGQTNASEQVELALLDIGWDRMQDALDDAFEERGAINGRQS
jgi:hypothetical protein